MKGRLLLAGAVAILSAGIAVGGFVWWKKVSEVHQQSDDELQQARDSLDAARTTDDKGKAQGFLTNARNRAQAAAQLWEKNAFEASLVEGEALLRLTKYSAAIEVLERAVAAHPDHAGAAELAASAHHQSFLLAKRDSDYAAALQLYDKALELGGPPRVLLEAARLAEAAGQAELADQTIARLEKSFPNSEELSAARALREARKPPENDR